MNLNHHTNKTAPVLNLFAKLPIPGQVKTRLIPSLGREGAADFAERLILFTFAVTTSKWPGERVLWLWPGTDHRIARVVASRFGVSIFTQCAGDLGEKMMLALDRDLQSGVPSAVMGCDLIHCDPDALAVAGARLHEGANIYGAAEDGGFWLLGLNHLAPALFDGVDWAVPGTGRSTLNRATELDILFDHYAPLLFDLDRPADFERFRQTFPTLYARLMDTEFDPDNAE